jgi:hypothetical protein
MIAALRVTETTGKSGSSHVEKPGNHGKNINAAALAAQESESACISQ